MERLRVLRKLDLGNSVAEFDEGLEDYFVETETFRRLVKDRGDIVAGDKGTGKTAIYKILAARYPTIPELTDVELLTGFNPEGNPIFERLAMGRVLEEGQYRTVWKAYILSLVGNWILGIYDGAMTEKMGELDEMLHDMGLRTSDDEATTVFNRLANLYRRITDPEDAEVTLMLTPEGIPIVSGRIGLGSGDETEGGRDEVPHREALGLLNDILEQSDLRAWVALDRLDEAFRSYPAVEVPALRALLRTFLDMAEFDRVSLKLFLRNDLFRRVTEGGFVNLTHVNARRIDIVWEDEDLLDLLGRRMAQNPKFLRDLGMDDDADAKALFGAVFPEQVDVGERKPTTDRWMMSRIRDGKGVNLNPALRA